MQVMSYFFWKCKYCGYELSDIYKHERIFILPKCISENEKIIKDIIE